MSEFSSQNLANTAWAFAELFTALARAAEPRIGNFKAQELANTAWAFPTTGQSDV